MFPESLRRGRSHFLEELESEVQKQHWGVSDERRGTG